MPLPMSNSAAWLPSLGEPLVVSASEVVAPGNGEVFVKNQAWAINPIDWKSQTLGLYMDKYPAVFGVDIAGEIVAVGDDVQEFRVSHTSCDKATIP
jgi:NADPH:quinone reductase-like Zn-dependent oxidoreductase